MTSRKMLEIITTITPLLAAALALWHQGRNTRNDLKADHARVVTRLEHIDSTIHEVKTELQLVHTRVDEAKTTALMNHERILLLEKPRG